MNHLSRNATVEIPIISRSQIKVAGQSGGSADKKRHRNLTVISNSFFEATREFVTRLDYPPYYPHLESIIISEDAGCYIFKNNKIAGELDEFKTAYLKFKVDYQL